jgi:Amt family ammonium transporter
MVEEETKVLVIEDDPLLAEMYRLRLVADGYGVAIGRDGEEGLRMAASQPPDFIYLDISLPGIDGFGVLEQLRAAPSTAMIPVVIVSNFGDPEMRQRGLLLGARDVLLKADTTPAQLSAAVGRTTRRSSAPAH